MRNVARVYLVGMAADGGVYDGMSTHEMTLLLGNEVLTVEGVLYADSDEDALACAWEEHVERLAQEGEEEGVTLGKVTDEEADALYAGRLCGSDEDEDGVEIVQVATATGWQLSVEGECMAEVVGNADAGTWSTAHASGTYEACAEWTGKRMVRFNMADGTVGDIVQAGEDCFKEAWLWGLGRYASVDVDAEG